MLYTQREEQMVWRQFIKKILFWITSIIHCC